MLNPEQKNRGIKLLQSLSVIECINAGGCLYAAYGVYTRLKQEGIDSDDVVIVQVQTPASYLDDFIVTNASYLQGLTSEPDSGFHFVLSFDGGKTTYDSDGEYFIQKGQLVIPNKDIEDFCTKSLRYGSWNWRFDRDEGLQQLNEILNTEIPDFY